MFKNLQSRIKYPFILFILLIAAKLAYIHFESGYNAEILTTLTSPTLIQSDIDALNDTGHMLASVGLTLLLVPVFYFFVKKKPLLQKYSFLALCCLISFLIIRQLLNITVDIIVEKNSDKRHNAYYTNIFKYGTLNNYFSYNSFIPNKHIAEQALTVTDKVLVINTFLLTFADENLINKLKSKGREKVASLYLTMNDKDYQEKYQQVKQLSQEVANSWEEFSRQRSALKKETDALIDENLIKEQHEKLLKTMNKNYKDYNDNTQQVENKIKEATSILNIQNAHYELEKYFLIRRGDKYVIKYGYDQKLEARYSQQMYNRFGHYVEPEEWLTNDAKLSVAHTESVIKKHIKISIEEETDGIPVGLSKSEFLNNLAVKAKVAKNLKKDGISISKNFDFSYEDFKKYVLLSANGSTQEIYKEFYHQLESKIGKNDLKLSDDWNRFVKSDYISGKITKEIADIDTDTLERLQTLLISKNIGDFKENVYLPTIQDAVNDELYSVEDFQSKDKAIHKGDDAIRLLYIPPFALALSMIALLLNIVTVSAMLLSISSLSKAKVYGAKLILYVAMIGLPLLHKGKLVNSSLFQEVSESNELLGYYVSFIDWITFYEKINLWLNSSLGG